MGSSLRTWAAGALATVVSYAAVTLASQGKFGIFQLVLVSSIVPALGLRTGKRVVHRPDTAGIDRNVDEYKNR